MRTGAAGAIAAKYLAPKKECVLGIIGTGRQAGAQVRAIARELPVSEVRVWSRNPNSRRGVCGTTGYPGQSQRFDRTGL